MQYQTTYFEKPGPTNTDATLKLTQEWSERLDIQTVLVASTSGSTGLKAVKLLKGREIIVVTHSCGFRDDNAQELIQENREQILALQGKILTCQHALAGISRAVRFQLKTYEIDEIIANALRIFGHGLKVAVEICLMAADAGLARTDADVIAVGGSSQGADTAAVIQPANVSRFFDLKVRGILCKPWNR
ncbi:hypothetical protein JW906_09520 [bacterium]|nr:hypothetical protein [bacterium]